MTDTPPCEPREELRGADGWHWLDGDRPIVARWYAASDYAGECWRINATQYSGEGAHKRGYRYIAPVTPAAEVDALRAEIGRLKGVVCVNALRAVASHADVDAMIGASEPAAVTLRATVAGLVEALEECATDLSDYLQAAYSHPAHAHRLERDMAPVVRARAMIAAAQETGDE